MFEKSSTRESFYVAALWLPKLSTSVTRCWAGHYTSRKPKKPSTPKTQRGKAGAHPLPVRSIHPSTPRARATPTPPSQNHWHPGPAKPGPTSQFHTPAARPRTCVGGSKGGAWLAHASAPTTRGRHHVPLRPARVADAPGPPPVTWRAPGGPSLLPPMAAGVGSARTADTVLRSSARRSGSWGIRTGGSERELLKTPEWSRVKLLVTLNARFNCRRFAGGAGPRRLRRELPVRSPAHRPPALVKEPRGRGWSLEARECFFFFQWENFRKQIICKILLLIFMLQCHDWNFFLLFIR
jgi:hypothetical protein